MATVIREGKFWIQITCRPGEGWPPSSYSISRLATWVAPHPVTKQGYGTSERETSY